MKPPAKKCNPAVLDKVRRMKICDIFDEYKAIVHLIGKEGAMSWLHMDESIFYNQIRLDSPILTMLPPSSDKKAPWEG